MAKPKTRQIDRDYWRRAGKEDGAAAVNRYIAKHTIEAFRALWDRTGMLPETYCAPPDDLSESLRKVYLDAYSRGKQGAAEQALRLVPTAMAVAS